MEFRKLLEQQEEKVENTILFIFYEGYIPDLKNPEEVLFYTEWWEKYKEILEKRNIAVSHSQKGITVEIPVNEYDSMVIHVPDIEEFINEDPDEIFTLWKEITPKGD